MVGDMVFDSSCLQHAGSGDNDTGFFLMIERFGLADVGDIAQRVKAKGIGIKTKGILHFVA